MNKYRLATAKSAASAQLVDDELGLESLHELDGVIGVAEDIATTQKANIEIGGQAQAHVNNGTTNCVGYLVILPRDAFDRHHDIVRHQHQLFLFDEDALLNCCKHAIADKRSLRLRCVVGNRHAKWPVERSLG